MTKWMSMVSGGSGFQRVVIGVGVIGVLAGNGAGVLAADWVQWAGNDRQGNWTETGILEKFPTGGLDFKWRTKIGSGYSGPVVAKGKVYVADYLPVKDTKTLEAIERIVCLDEKTGKILWTHDWETSYRVQMHSYATGPRATPSIDGDRVYAMGSNGIIQCVNAETGEPIWSIHSVKEFNANIPIWGMSCSPLVDGEKIIFVTGGQDGGQVKAFDKMTGKEIWRALPTAYEMGYSPPVIYEMGGKRQLIVWDPKALHSLDPETGKVYWSEPFSVKGNMTIGMPVKSGSKLLVSCFYSGSMLMDLDSSKPAAKQIWKIAGKGEKPGQTEGLHAVITTPIIIGGHFYGTCSYGELRGLELASGKRVWESDQIGRQGRWGSFFWVKNGDRYFINNDAGELIIARFSPEGFEVIDRTKLIEPNTSSGFGPARFYDSTVNWVHPAYANKHIFTRNDGEIVCASLAKE